MLGTMLGHGIPRRSAGTPPTRAATADSDDRRAPPRRVLGAGLLRGQGVLALGADGAGAAHDPMGPGGLQRPPETLRAVLELWGERRRDAAAAGVGEHASRISGVSGRADGARSRRVKLIQSG